MMVCCLLLGTVASALAHPDLQAGKELMRNADFRAALLLLDQAQRSPELTEADLVEAIEAWLANPDALRQMKERAWSLGRRNGADRIAELVECLAERRSAQRLPGQH